MKDKTSVIIGAGPAGLTAAYELVTHTKCKTEIFEATNDIGGISKTINYKGNRIDIGGHRFFSKNDRVMNWWFQFFKLESDIDDPRLKNIKNCSTNQTAGNNDIMLYRFRISHILYRSKLFCYPLSITLSAVWKLGILETFLIALSYLRSKFLPIKNEEYLDAFFINRFGKRLYLLFFKEYTEKVWGIPCNEIKSNWGAQRIKGLSLRRAITHAVHDLLSSDFKKSQKKRETSLITRFYYPKYGPGQMWENVSNESQKKGAKIHMQNEVVKIFHKDDQILKIHVQSKASEKLLEINCDYCFSSMPLRSFIKKLSPAPPKEILKIANGLQYRNFITVGLLLKKLHISTEGQQPKTSTDDTWIYVQEPNSKIGRVQFFNNWSPYLVAKKDTQWIGLEYFVSENEKMWFQSDDEVIKEAIAEAHKINIILPEDYIDACVCRMPKAYPIYTGTYNEIKKLKNYVQSFENLFILGRNGQHRYNNQDHSMLTALLAVDSIRNGNPDNISIWDVNVEKEYHEKISH